MLILTISDVLKFRIKKTVNPESMMASKKKPYKQRLRSKIKKFNETLLTELILNNQIYEFPGGFGHMFIAERDYNSHLYKEVVLIISLSKKGYFRTNGNLILPQLDRKWRLLLDEEVKNGHRYENFSVIIERLYAK